MLTIIEIDQRFQWLQRCGRKVYSQFNEDGIIASIIECIGEGNRTCLEVGAFDGMTGSNTRRLLDLGWTGVLIESDPMLFDVCRQRTIRLNNVICPAPHTILVHRAIEPTGPNSIDSILMEQGPQHPIHFMSIDTDTVDAEIWSQLKERPPIMCVEWLEHTTDNTEKVLEVGDRKGYDAVAKTETNFIFVDREYSHLLESE